MRWSEAQFYALPDDEQARWLAWTYQRQRRTDDTIWRILDNKNSDGKVSAETATAQALLALLELS